MQKIEGIGQNNNNNNKNNNNNNNNNILPPAQGGTPPAPHRQSHKALKASTGNDRGKVTPGTTQNARPLYGRVTKHKQNRVGSGSTERKRGEGEGGRQKGMTLGENK